MAWPPCREGFCTHLAFLFLILTCLTPTVAHAHKISSVGAQQAATRTPAPREGKEGAWIQVVPDFRTPAVSPLERRYLVV